MIMKNLFTRNISNQNFKYAFLKFNLLLYSLIILSGCTTTVNFTERKLPEINLNDTTNKIGFINLYDADSVFTDKIKNQRIIKSGVTVLTNSILSDLKAEPLFNDDVVSLYRKGRAPSLLPAVYNADSVSDICEKYNLDYLLALESYNADFNKEVDVVKNEDGSKTKTAYFDLEIYAGFTLYDSQGEVMDRRTEKRVMFYKSREVLSAIFTIYPPLAKAGEEVDILSNDIGRQYMDNYFISFVPRTLLFYTAKEFKAIKPYLFDDDWESVIEYLIPLTKSSKQNTRRYAAQNLSYVYEIIDDKEQADFWMKKAKN